MSTATELTAAPHADAATLADDDVLAKQKALVALGRRAVAPPEAAILIRDAAALLAEMLHADYGLAAELSADKTAFELRLVAPGASHEEERDAMPTRTVPNTAADSLPGYVLNVALPTAISDLTAERRFNDGLLRKRGVQAAIAAPLMLVDRAYGALAACFLAPRAFNDEDVLFVETVSHLVTSTISRSQAERWLADERRFSTGLVETLDALVLVLDQQGLVLRTNPACERATGFSAEELRGRRLEATLAVPEELHLFRNALGSVLADRRRTEFESRLLTKHAQQRHVAWTLAATAAGPTTAPTVIVTGIDVTRERQLEAKLLTDAAASRPAAAVDPMAAMNVERRKRPRRSYPYRQMIAPAVDGKRPDAEAFFAVTCNDIGAGGFSFLTHQPLPSDGVVVALGNPPNLTYLSAKVVHVNRVEYQGRWVFLIGCNYLGRLQYGS